MQFFHAGTLAVGVVVFAVEESLVVVVRNSGFVLELLVVVALVPRLTVPDDVLGLTKVFPELGLRGTFGVVGFIMLVVIDVIFVALVLSLTVFLAAVEILSDVLTALNVLALFGVGGLCGTLGGSGLAAFDVLFV